MKRSALILTLIPCAALAGPYSGPVGGDGGIGQPVAGFVGELGDGYVGEGNYINPVFQGWASRVVDYSPADDPSLDAQWKNPQMALGQIYKVNPNMPATKDRVPTLEYAVVSLGELSKQQIADGAKPGSITLGFDMKITNGAGYDFAVFENGFSDGANLIFMELAYVEVSTDGINFARFPSVSLNDYLPDDYENWGDEQVALAYGQRDATNVHNLAGKHVNHGDESWGTGFDLEDLVHDDLVVNGIVDLNNINFIRLVDIPGTGEFKDGTVPEPGNPIFDPWQTYGSGGFDLAGIGIINGEYIPEPATVGILLLTALGAFALRRRRQNVRGQ